ncbi:methyltransferase, FxLD system [Nocardiopsis sp. JB363]|uniref:methyltransferase, FxLD system n=1 Tax=Nocardiopsis sp. JB363 TaxID=1434837 RepID=UPI000979CB86|nr:methyltransferase, FxLD system [Nocardiopsis sp. JB363]SIO85541.1 Protein-L-isoaspartate O-methyltransferase [Nocardiopsis sp. JB363]
MAANPTSEQWRNRMVAELCRPGTVGGEFLSPRVEQALRTVPRHLFIPEADLEQAYAPFSPVMTKRDEEQGYVSSVSAPQIQAMMLGQADLRPGQRVLEVGSGGYNAALIAEVVGPEGEVTTVDIDPDITARARELLAAGGYDRVRVVTADAAQGVEEGASYDAIIVTAGAWDVPPAWIEQLTEGGRLVVPLRVRGLTRSIGFVEHDGSLHSTSALMCGFVPMRGADDHRETLLRLRGTGEIVLSFDEEAPEEPHLLDHAVRTPRVELWTGVRVTLRELIDTLQLYLATTLPGFCVMTVDPALDTGTVAPNSTRFAMAAVEGGDFAYLVTRRVEGEELVEYGVHAFGPTAEEFAERVGLRVREWDRDQRGGPGPEIRVYPVSVPVDRLPEDLVVTKRHTHVTFSWPTP